MPDLIPTAFYQCLSCSIFETTIQGSTGAPKRVTWGPTPRGPYEYGWLCTCDGFRFRKTCRHVKQAEESGIRCGWDQYEHGGSPDLDERGNRVCPRCKGPVTTQLIGV